MALIDDVNERRREIRTDGYAMSIGEWSSLYENKEVDIHPEFQRFYRWSEAQKTNLIESILLGIPIPLFLLVSAKTVSGMSLMAFKDSLQFISLWAH